MNMENIFKCIDKEIESFENLLRLAERIGIHDNVNKLYYLLTRNDLIYEETFSNENYLIQNARLNLTKINLSTEYKRLLEIYKKEENAIYEIKEDNSFKVKDNISNIPKYEERIELYDSILDGNKNRIEHNKKQNNTKVGKKYKIRIDSDNETVIKMEEINGPDQTESLKVKKGGPLRFTIDKILEAATKLDKIEGTNYRKKVLENNIYKVVDKEEKLKTSEFLMDGVVNMAGQVGAGKSTFADALTLVANNEKYRTCMILDTVDAVLKKAELFEKAGLNVGVLIGEGGKENHFKNQLKGVDYPSEISSKILQSPCLINGLYGKTEEFNNLIKYGKEPCFSLTEEKNDKNFICGYYDICPKTAASRKIECADVVLTTVAGFSYCKFGKERKTFLNYVIDSFDLIVVDEVDNLLCKVDTFFAPTIKCNEYIQKAENYCSKYRQLDIKGKIKEPELKKRYIFTLEGFGAYMAILTEKIDNKCTGWPDSKLKDFSALKLIELLKKDLENYSDKKYIINVLRNLLESGFTGEDYLINAYTKNTVVDVISLYSKKDKKQVEKDIIELGEKNIEKLIFLLELITFEKLYKKISYDIRNLSDIPGELKSILIGLMTDQQKMLSNAPIGNIFGMEYRKDDDLYIKKLNALGRIAFLKMSYLAVDRYGNNIGPNVLLMSGTGYIPGAYRFHISDKVDYIIEATKEKREFIEKTKIYNLNSSNRVSGTKLENRNKALKELIKENSKTIKKCIENDERILMVVNSYEQSEVASNEIKKIIENNNLNVNVRALVSDSSEYADDGEFIIKRSDVTKFDDEILVAPACVIERGHNIVDYFGNAWFNTVMFLVRPMSNPNDFFMQMESLNGYIVNKFANRKYEDRIKIVDDIRKEAYRFYRSLVFYSEGNKGLKNLPDELKKDAIASLFVIINQVFGRLCRVNDTTDVKPPSIYWVDGAFNGEMKSNEFDTVTEIKEYLEDIMVNSENPIVAKTLYGSLYEAMEEGDKDEK